MIELIRIKNLVYLQIIYDFMTNIGFSGMIIKKYSENLDVIFRY